jgi:acyl dehydratase
MSRPDLPSLLSAASPLCESSYTDRDCMLYALATGFSEDPLHRAELAYTYERELKVSPSFASATGPDYAFLAGTGLNLALGVHGAVRLKLHCVLPTAARLRARTRVTEVIDKGEGRGLLLVTETPVENAESGAALYTATNTLFFRGDGGIGGKSTGGELPHELPSRAPDKIVRRATRPNQALYYRLLGDRTPIHADPEAASVARFPRPLLHGLATYGFACRAVLEAWCDYDAARIVELDARFSAPMFPGETIVTETWADGPVISFRCRLAERDAFVINNGRALLA